MSFYVELTLEDKVYQVRRYLITVEREKDDKGRPQSDPTWKLFVVLDGLKDDKGSLITNWMLDPKKMVDGKLTIYDLAGTKIKEVVFKKSSCIQLVETYSINLSFLTNFLMIRGKDIKINTAEVIQKWAGNNS